MPKEISDAESEWENVMKDANKINGIRSLPKPYTPADLQVFLETLHTNNPNDNEVSSLLQRVKASIALANRYKALRQNTVNLNVSKPSKRI